MFASLSNESPGLQIQWEKTLAQPTYGHQVLETEDHGFMLVGISSENDQEFISFTRLDSLRNEVWQRNLILDERILVIKLLKNQANNFIVANINTYRSNYSFSEVNEEGDSVSFHRFEDDLQGITVYPMDAIVGSNGHYLVLVGVEHDGFDVEFYIREYDQDYNLIEEHFISRPGHGLKLTHLTELAGGGYFIAGDDYPRDEDGNDYRLRIVIKTDGDLNVLWRKHIGRSMSVNVEGIGKLHDNIYGLWGRRNDRNFLYLFDSDGNIYPDSLYFERRVRPLDYIAYGNSSYVYPFEYPSNVRPDSLANAKVITLYDSEMDSVESRFWLHDDHPGSFQDVISCTDGGVLISTVTHNVHLIKIAPPGWVPNHVEEDIFNPVNGFQLIHAFPNPFNSAVTIQFSKSLTPHSEVQVYNAFGRRVDEFSLQVFAGGSRIVWNPGSISSGTYLVRISDINHQYTIPVNLLR
jgi:hypothetical protein